MGPSMPSLPARGAWIEMSRTSASIFSPKSLPARGAWIEIMNMNVYYSFHKVAPRTGSVD